MFKGYFAPNLTAKTYQLGNITGFILPRISITSRFILQCDIKKYFPSIDHQILKNLIRRKIKCPNTIWLIDLLIDHSNPQEASFEYFLGDSLLTTYTQEQQTSSANTVQMSLESFLIAKSYLTKPQKPFIVVRS